MITERRRRGLVTMTMITGRHHRSQDMAMTIIVRRPQGLVTMTMITGTGHAAMTDRR